jgi:hypothetical protein
LTEKFSSSGPGLPTIKTTSCSQVKIIMRLEFIISNHSFDQAVGWNFKRLTPLAAFRKLGAQVCRRVSFTFLRNTYMVNDWELCLSIRVFR